MAGLYVHVPFCHRKCLYCNFFSVNYDNVLADKYIDALIKHAVKFKDEKIDSVYIGGGTPSVLSLGQIRRLLEVLNEVFDLSRVQEFTFELNPESVSKEKLCILRKLGVNRLSIGLQSVEDKSLKFLGRAHDFRTFCSTYDTAREENFDNINIDLLYGLPEQTLKDWKKVLKETLLFNSEHLSLYPLSIEEHTSFYRNKTVICGDIQRDMYDYGAEMLAAKGYGHYEISNWAKRNRESFHNTNYWRNFEYVGIGAGAAGYLKRNRYKNIEDVNMYISLLENDCSTEFENECIDDKLYETETIILGLRLLNEGLDTRCFNSPEKYNILLECLKNKMLEIKNGKVKLVKECVFIFNQIVSKFV
ncbi:MAG: radical SAM family heme chaperone HemW [Endomicrobium sp.]|jgi:oxygen-independent coproporphyrinogen-3 oxidase|nr:radical SAM family heme chaperone HemW [Endomicrobium sp.]